MCWMENKFATFETWKHQEDIHAQVVKAQENTAPTTFLSHVLRAEEHPLHSCAKVCVQRVPWSLFILECVTNVCVQIVCTEFHCCYIPSNFLYPGPRKDPGLHRAQCPAVSVSSSNGHSKQMYSTQPFLWLRGMFPAKPNSLMQTNTEKPEKFPVVSIWIMKL